MKQMVLNFHERQEEEEYQGKKSKPRSVLGLVKSAFGARAVEVVNLRLNI